MYEAPDSSPPTQPTPASSPTHRRSTRKRKKPDYQHWLFEPYNPVRGESALWAAVITQALMDALGNSRNPESIYHKHEAIRWLTEPNKDFVMVCHLAGFDADYIRRKAKRAIANPVKWRADAGKGSRYESRKAYRQKLKAQKAKTETRQEIKQPTILTGFWE